MTIKEAKSINVEALKKEALELAKKEKEVYFSQQKRYKGDTPLSVFTAETKPIFDRQNEIEKLLCIHAFANCKAGDGATLLFWSDRHACTIVERPNDSTIILQQDNAIRIDDNGMSDCQEYRYERNKEGTTYTARWSRKRNGWFLSDCYKGTPVGVGYRREYYDYCF